MKKLILGASSLVVLTAMLNGCAGFSGGIQTHQKGCSYGFFLVPALSVPRWLNACGPVLKPGEKPTAAVTPASNTASKSS